MSGRADFYSSCASSSDNLFGGSDVVFFDFVFDLVFDLVFACFSRSRWLGVTGAYCSRNFVLDTCFEVKNAISQTSTEAKAAAPKVTEA